MKIGNVSSDCQTRESFSRRPIADICGNTPNNLHPVSFSRKHDGTATDAIDGNSVNQVCMLPFVSGTDIPGEETKRIGSDCRESEPPNFGPYDQRNSDW